MRMFSIVFFALFGGAMILSASSASAQGSGDTQRPDAPIGKVISVTGTASIEHAVAVVLQANLANGAVSAKAGDSVYQGDVVQTGADGKIALAFTDGTAFNLSSNGRMVLNEFIYNPNSTSNSTLFSLAKGNFTFVAGKVAKSGNMKFDTPVATMGIRGTTPNVDIADDGTVKFSTLVEGKRDAVTSNSRVNQRNLRVNPNRQRQGRDSGPSMSAEQTASYNKLFNLDTKVCRGC
jgi:hypothetical protein